MKSIEHSKEMNILEYTREYMHTHYPISLKYEFVHHPVGNPETDGTVVCSDALDDIILNVYNNRTLELQARSFVHKYHHLTQLENMGFRSRYRTAGFMN